MLGESTSMSKNPPSTGIDEKSTSCSISTSCSTSFPTSIALFQPILPP